MFCMGVKGNELRRAFSICACVTFAYFVIIMNTAHNPQTNAGHGDTIWYTSADLARRWGVHSMTIRRWHRAGKLKGYAFGAGTIRYAKSDVDTFESEAFTK
jgi:excisionase family DNA binding protein